MLVVIHWPAFSHGLADLTAARAIPTRSIFIHFQDGIQKANWDLDGFGSLNSGDPSIGKSSMNLCNHPNMLVVWLGTPSIQGYPLTAPPVSLVNSHPDTCANSYHRGVWFCNVGSQQEQHGSQISKQRWQGAHGVFQVLIPECCQKPKALLAADGWLQKIWLMGQASCV